MLVISSQDTSFVDTGALTAEILMLRAQISCHRDAIPEFRPDTVVQTISKQHGNLFCLIHKNLWQLLSFNEVGD